MLLNFGHTLAHAYELAGHYTRWTHGQAVAAGMCSISRLGAALGVTPAQVPEQIRSALAALGLPTDLSCTREEYAAAIGLDKKGSGQDITLVLLEEMGRGIPYRTTKHTVLEWLEGQA